MEEREAFDLIDEVKAAAMAEGATVRTSMLTFDHAFDPDQVIASWEIAGRQLLTIALPGYLAARAFLKKASGPMQRLLDRASIRFHLEIDGGKPAKFSLSGGIELVRKAIDDGAEAEDHENADHS